MRIAAVVILFHPPQSFISNLNSYYDYLDRIFVFDNTEADPLLKDVLQQLPKVEYYHDNNNEGIAKRLNAGAEKAMQQGFSWMLTMDQDSFFAGTMGDYLNCFHEFRDKENVALFGTKYGRSTLDVSRKCLPAEIHELITSGTLVNLSLFKEIGKFDEALFIDSVDHDYCIRAKSFGYSLTRFSNICLSHELGKKVYASSIKTLFLIKKEKAIHSPLRCYYMYRNLLYLEKKYAGVDVSLLKSVRKTAISNIKNSFFYGRQPIKIIRYLLAARSDHKKMKMGKIEKEL
jgi:rhamnosyltransferase